MLNRFGFVTVWALVLVLSHFTAEGTTSSPTSEPVTTNPTSTPVSSNPTTHPVTFNPTTSPETFNPTSSPATFNPTSSPATFNPTCSPATSNPTTTNPTRLPTPSLTNSPTANPITVNPTSESPTKAPGTLSPTSVPSSSPRTINPSTLAPTQCPATIAPSHPCGVCNSGEYYDSGYCVECSAGYFCPGACMARVPCPLGTANSLVGQANITSCTACTAGYFTGVAGSISCSLCTSGYECPDANMSVPIQCGPGNYSHAGSTFCEACPAGYRCSSAGLVACSLGSYSALGSMTCLTCPAGFSCLDAAAEPIICSGGTAATEGSPTCNTCPTGYYANSTGLASCIGCPEGHSCGNPAHDPVLCDVGTSASSFSTQCTTCLDGYYAPNPGSIACSPCPAGYYCVNSQNTTQCPTGYFSELGNSTCSMCPSGKVSNTIGDGCDLCPPGYECSSPSTGPQLCATGYYSTGGSSVTECTQCPAGSHCPSVFSSPLACPEGTFSFAGHTNCTACWAGHDCSGGIPVTCPAGWYSREGEHACSQCPPGYQCPIASEEPLACLNGTYSPGNSTTCLTCLPGWRCPSTTYTVECSPGWYSQGASLDCTECPAGFKCPNTTSGPIECSVGEYALAGSQSCTTCPAGYACLSRYTSPSQCVVGTYSTGGQTVCISCDPGFACPSTSSSSKTQCYSGSYSSGGQGSCTTCPAGSECPYTDQNVVISCLPGYYSLGNQSTCTMCPAGQQCPNLDGTGLSSCVTGYYSPGGLTACIGCPAGYSCPSSTTADDIVKCSAGSYSLLGSSVCTSCPAGFECPDTTTNTQTVCNLGYYSTGGQAKCTACTPGYACSATGIITKCIAGSYSTTPNSVCTTCPAGHYCSHTNREPIRCEPGYYTETIGNATQCILCEEGYQCQTGLREPCPIGTHSSAGAKNCTACYAGRWCNQTTLPTSALPGYACPAGYWCPRGTWESGLITDCPNGRCPCPAGYFGDITGAETKLSGCDPCPERFYCDTEATTTPLDCPKGWYCPRGTTSAYENPCPAGTYGYNGSLSALSECFDCPPGRYCSEAYSGGDGNICPPGHYCPHRTQNAFQYPCPAGTYSNLWGAYGVENCTTCVAGSYCPQGSTGPLTCPAGTYSPLSGVGEVTGCIECPAGYYCPNNGLTNLATILSTYRCPEGHYCPARTEYSTANPCPPGTYQPYQNKTNINDCLVCPAGYWCDWRTTSDTGSTPKQACVAGHYCPEKSSSGTIFPCPPGTYNPHTNGTAEYDCIYCPVGKYCEGGKPYISGDCEPGHYCPEGTNSTNLFPCPAGSYWPYTNGTGQSDCLTCPVGTYCLEASSYPTNCTHGTYNNQPGATMEGSRFNGTVWPSCTSCPAGFECHSWALGGLGNGTVDPTPCQSGYYSAMGEEDCKPCEAGFYCPRAAVSNQSMYDSYTCPEGYFCPSGTAAYSLQCQAGAYCPAGSGEPTRCPPGTYQPSTGQSSCFTCPAGFYCTEGASNMTGPCDPGYYCQAGSTGANSAPCPAGTFSVTGTKIEGNCSECTGGYYCPVATATPIECPQGHYCPPGATWKNPCPLGTYSNQTKNIYSSNCTLCDGGRFCDSLGLTAVAGLCAAGHYCSHGAREANPFDGLTGNLCPSGHYCAEGVEAAAKCPSGTYNPVNGSKTITACQACPAGYYCGEAGQTTFSTCCEPGFYCTGGASHPRQYHSPAGYYSEGCAEDPTPCPLGYWNPYLNQSVCQKCMAGFLCPEIGMYNLTGFDCPRGSYCPEGSFIEILCPKGSFSNELGRTTAGTCTACTPGHYCETNGLQSPTGKCTAGFFCSGNSTDPTPTIQSFGSYCPKGHYCPEGSDAGIPCPQGTYLDAERGFKLEDCTFCTPGYVCNETGLVSPYIQCGPGYYCGANATSVKPVNDGSNGICPTGSYCPQGSHTPSTCAAGTYADVQGLAECKTCPAGSFCLAGTITPIACPEGYYCPNSSTIGTAYPCPIGTFSNVTGSQKQSDCYDCTEGMYCETTAAKTPTGACERGYFCLPGAQNKYGKTSNATENLCPQGSFCPAQTGGPKKCPPGTFSNNTGAYSIAICEHCTPGYYCGASGLSKPSGLCSAGYYCTRNATLPNPTDGVMGAICPVGYECPIGSWEPTECQAGNYSNTTGASTCTLCPEGFYCPVRAEQPTECPPGYYCPVGTKSDNENPCPSSTYNNLTMRTKLLDCLSCPPGQYCEMSGQDVPTGYCQAGHYCTGGSSVKNPNSTVGGFCTLGNYCPVGSTAEVPCTAGSYCASYRLETPSGACHGGYFCIEGSNTPTHTVCPAGFFCPVGTVDPFPCPQGTYQPGTGAMDQSAACKACPSGYFCNVTGIDNVNASHLCPEGMYCLNGTITPTLECWAGHKCPIGTGWPVACSSGTYQNQIGQGSCKTCEAGRYCEGNGNQNMTDCPKGYYCLNGTTFATEFPCPNGTFNPSTQGSTVSDCTPCTKGSYCAGVGNEAPTGYCEAGYYCLGGAYNATPTDATTGNICPPGFYCEINSTLPTACGVGRFSNGLGNKALSDCTDCPRGQYCADASGTELNANNSGPCNAGYLCILGSGVPTPTNGVNGFACRPGHFCVTGALNEQGCQAGTYNPDTGQGECYACPAGFECGAENLTSVAGRDCPVGFYCPAGTANPIPCPVGTYSVSIGLQGVGNCTTCPVGRYCDQQNMTVPGTGDCAGGYYCTTGNSGPAPGGNVTRGVTGSWEGSGRCPTGYYCPNGTAAPIACNAGKYNPNLGQNEEADCIPCPSGEYCETAGLSLPTGNCTAGYYCVEGTSNPENEPCPYGHQCPGGSPYPERCPSATYAPVRGLAACYDCPSSYYCPENSTNPILCPAHSYCPNNTAMHIRCMNGTYTNETGLHSQSQCRDCPPGYYCVDGDVSGMCSAGYICWRGNYDPQPDSPAFSPVIGEPCPKGHYCPMGIEEPIPCPNKTYRNASYGEKLADCSPCPAGRKCDIGTTEPIQCPRGHYCPLGENEFPCPIRTYNTLFNMSSLADCLTCPKGYLCDSIGIADLNSHICPVRAYCRSGVNESIPCWAGTFQDVPGAGGPNECQACPGGFYCPYATLSPLPCWNGTYCPGNATYPLPCPGGSYCQANATYPITCPAGYYCTANSSSPIICDEAGTYCRTGSEVPTRCGNGTRWLESNNHTSFDVSCADCLPGYWQINDTENACMECDAGYVCTGKASTPTPLYDYQGGYKCPNGYYCPKATSDKIACPVGTYNDQEGLSSPDSCISCAEGTYNNLEGQSGCFSCSATSKSQSGSKSCECEGKNRVFTTFDASCVCKNGYSYTDSAGQDASQADGNGDCEPIVFARCSSGQSRKTNGACVDVTYDCGHEEDCGDVKGTYSARLGTCQCNDVALIDDVCDASCRDSKPYIRLIDRTIYVYPNSSYLVATCSASIISLPGFGDYTDCSGTTCTMFSSEVTTNGITGSYSIPEGIITSLSTVCPEARGYSTGSVSLLGSHLILPVAPAVNATATFYWDGDEYGGHGRQLLDTSSSTTASFNPALYCLLRGEGVLFSVSGTSYPKYVVNDLLNEPSDFDYGAFTELETKLQANATSITVFAYSFTTIGTFVFSQSASLTARKTVFRVLPSSSQCPSDARIMPFTIENLNLLGVDKNDDLLLEPDWGLIGTMAGLVIAVLIGLIAGAWHFKNSGWGTDEAAHPMYRRRAKKNTLALWNFNSKGSVVQREDTSKGLRDPNDLSIEGEVTPAGARPVQTTVRIGSNKGKIDSDYVLLDNNGSSDNLKAVPVSHSADKPYMYEWQDHISTEDFDFHSLYKQLELSREHFARHFAEQEEDLRSFYAHMSDETDHLKSVLAVKMNVQLKTSGEGFGEAVRRLVTAEINARRSFQWRFENMRQSIWQAVTSDMTNIINTIRKDDYNISSVTNQCRRIQQQIMHLLREIEHERTRRRAFGSHVEVVGLPIVKALNDLDLVEKKVQDMLTIQLNTFNFGINSVLERISRLHEKFAAAKNATSNTIGGEEKLKRLQQKQHLKMIKQAKAVGDKCSALRDELAALNEDIEFADNRITERHEQVMTSLLQEREQQVADSSTNLFRGINPDMSKVLSGLLGMKGGFLYDEKTCTLKRAEPFDPADPFTGIVDSSLDSEAKVLRGQLEKLQLEMGAQGEENEAELAKLQGEIHKLKKQHEEKKKELEDRIRQENEARAVAENLSEEKDKQLRDAEVKIEEARVAGAKLAEITGATEVAGAPGVAVAREEMLAEGGDEKVHSGMMMDIELQEREKEQQEVKKRIERIKNLQKKFDLQRKERQRIEKTNEDEIKKLEAEMKQDQEEFKKLLKNPNDASHLINGDLSIVKEAEVQLILQGDAEEVDEVKRAGKRRERLHKLALRRKKHREERIKEAKKKSDEATTKAKKLEINLARELKKERLLNQLAEGNDGDVADLKSVEDKMREAMGNSVGDLEALLLEDARRLASEGGAVNGVLVHMADKKRAKKLAALQKTKAEQMDLIKANIAKQLAQERNTIDEEKEKRIKANPELREQIEKEAQDAFLKVQVSLLQEHLDQERKLAERINAQMRVHNNAVIQQLHGAVVTVGTVLNNEVKEEAKIEEFIENDFDEQVAMARKNLDAATDARQRLKLEEEFDELVLRLRGLADKKIEEKIGVLRKTNYEKIRKDHGEDVAELLIKARQDRDKAIKRLGLEAELEREKLGVHLRRRRAAARKRLQERGGEDEEAVKDFIREMNNITDAQLKGDKGIRNTFRNGVQKIKKDTAEELERSKDAALNHIRDWNKLQEKRQAEEQKPVRPLMGDITNLNTGALRKRISDLQGEVLRREETDKHVFDAERAKLMVNNLLDSFLTKHKRATVALDEEREREMERMQRRREIMRERFKKRRDDNENIEGGVTQEEMDHIRKSLNNLSPDVREAAAKDIIEAVLRSRHKNQKIGLARKSQSEIEKLKEHPEEMASKLPVLLEQQTKNFSDLSSKHEQEVKDVMKRIFPDFRFDGPEWAWKPAGAVVGEKRDVQKGVLSDSGRMDEKKRDEKIAMRMARKIEEAKARRRIEEAAKAGASEERMKLMASGKQASDQILKEYIADEKQLDKAIILEQERQLAALQKELENRKKRLMNKRRLKDHMMFLHTTTKQDALVKGAATVWAGRGGPAGEGESLEPTYSMEQFKQEFGGQVNPHELEIFKKLRNIESLMRGYRQTTKSWQRSHFIDRKDREVFQASSEISEPTICDLEDLSTREVMLYRFGLALLQVLYKNGRAFRGPLFMPDSKEGVDQDKLLEPPLLLLATDLPPNPFQTAYKNSFWYQHSANPVPDHPEEGDAHTLFIRRERLQDVGEFILVLVHTSAHIISRHWEDRHPKFLELFHKLLQFCCADLFLSRSNNSLQDTSKTDVNEVVALKMQLQQNVGDVSDHQLQQRMRKYMLFTHSEAIQSHLSGISKNRVRHESRVEKLKVHASNEVGPKITELEHLADQLDGEMCTVVMELFRISTEIKKQETSGGLTSPVAGTLSVKELKMQRRRLEEEKARLAEKLQQVSAELNEQ